MQDKVEGGFGWEGGVRGIGDAERDRPNPDLPNAERLSRILTRSRGLKAGA
jgi:hypothetical protein